MIAEHGRLAALHDPGQVGVGHPRPQRGRHRQRVHDVAERRELDEGDPNPRHVVKLATILAITSRVECDFGSPVMATRAPTARAVAASGTPSLV